MELLDLPNELLLNIASNCNVPELLALSSTCHQLSDIAQELLVGTATFSAKNIQKLVETLQSKPGLCKAITHMRLGPLKFKEIEELCPRPKSGKWEDAYEVLYNTYRKQRKPFDLRSILPTEARASVHLARLLTLSSRLKAISVGSRSVEVLPLLCFCLDGTSQMYRRRMLDWYVQVRKDLQKQLEVLEVVPEHLLPNADPKSKPDFASWLWPTTYIKLVHFDQLKRLTVPPRMIVCRPKDTNTPRDSPLEPTDPCQMLPKSLEFVRFILDGGQMFGEKGLPRFSWICKLLAASSEFTKLREVELLFEFNILSNLPECMNRLAATTILTQMEEWKKGSIKVTTTFPKNPGSSGGIQIYEPTQYVERDFVTALRDALAES